VQSTVWRVPLCGAAPKAWATGPALAPVNGFGANGLKVHNGVVWVSNIGAGTLLRIDAPSHIRTVATRLGPIDDFAFNGDTVFAAINQDNRFVRIDHAPRPPCSPPPTDLSNPIAVAIRGSTIYITNAAYLTRHDPSLMILTVRRTARRGVVTIPVWSAEVCVVGPWVVDRESVTGGEAHDGFDRRRAHGAESHMHDHVIDAHIERGGRPRAVLPVDGRAVIGVDGLQLIVERPDSLIGLSWYVPLPSEATFEHFTGGIGTVAGGQRQHGQIETHHTSLSRNSNTTVRPTGLDR